MSYAAMHGRSHIDSHQHRASPRSSGGDIRPLAIDIATPPIFKRRNAIGGWYDANGVYRLSMYSAGFYGDEDVFERFRTEVRAKYGLGPHLPWKPTK